jgi:hypothetical protein
VEEHRDFVSADHARLRLSGGGHVRIDRLGSSSTLVLPDRPADTEVVHPYLGLTAGVAARWRGWYCFHAGGVLIEDGVWGVLGHKGTGKSTLLAWLAGADKGHRILCDDVLVLDDSGQALVGPRCIDLRDEAAAWLGTGEPIGLVGARNRWRLRLGPTVTRAPLRGWITLDWGEATEVISVPPRERLPLLVRNMTLRLWPPNPSALMGLATLPAWCLRRPRRLGSLEDSTERLIAALAPH